MGEGLPGLRTYSFYLPLSSCRCEKFERAPPAVRSTPGSTGLASTRKLPPYVLLVPYRRIRGEEIGIDNGVHIRSCKEARQRRDAALRLTQRAVTLK